MPANAREAKSDQAGDQEHVMTIAVRVVGFKVGSSFYFTVTIGPFIKPPCAKKIKSLRFSLVHILKWWLAVAWYITF